MRDIGKNIKLLRQRKNLTQEELADKLFVTRQTVSNYENGKTRPDVEMILRIAQVLEVDANAVFYGPPQAPDRKKAFVRLTVAAGLFLILMTVCLALDPIAEERYQCFRMGLMMLLKVFMHPVLALIFGWLLFQALSIVLGFKVLQGPWVGYVRMIVLVSTVFLLTVSLIRPVFAMYADHLAQTQGSVSLSLDLGAVLNLLVYHISNFNVKGAAVYALLGSALWILGFPFKK